MNNLRSYSVPLLIALVVASFYFLGKRQKEQSTESARKTVEAASETRVSKIKALAARHEAVYDWLSSLPARGNFVTPFTLDVTRALVRSNQQPVLLEVKLLDVARKNGALFAAFSGYYFTNARFINLDVSLTCSPEQAERLMKVSTQSQLRLAVVARIHAVSRPDFTAQAHGREESLSIDVDSTPGRLYCQGSLLDFLLLDEK